MDETTLRELLDDALIHEPPIGPVAHNALQAGIRLRGRRRAQRIAGSMAALAVIAATIPVVAQSHSPNAVAPAEAIMYVAAANGVTPVSTATNTPGTPIKLGTQPGSIAITPDGKTAYIANLSPATVIPVSTATNTPGKPIKLGGGHTEAIAITPDGKTAYVVNVLPKETRVIPVSTATNRPGKPINLGGSPATGTAAAITPDGKTAYVVSGGAAGTTVIPVSTATNTPGKPIRLGGGSVAGDAAAIAITPDGKTAYVARGARIAGSFGAVIPVSTATNMPGKPIKIGRMPQGIVITP